MIINPNNGIGTVKFGMSPIEVNDVMGDTVYEDWMGGNLNDSMYYSGLIIGFDKYDSSGPLSESKVIEFRTNDTDLISFNGIKLNEFTREGMKDVCIWGDGWTGS